MNIDFFLKKYFKCSLTGISFFFTRKTGQDERYISNIVITDKYLIIDKYKSKICRRIKEKILKTVKNLLLKLEKL